MFQSVKVLLESRVLPCHYLFLLVWVCKAVVSADTDVGAHCCVCSWCWLLIPLCSGSFPGRATSLLHLIAFLSSFGLWEKPPEGTSRYGPWQIGFWVLVSLSAFHTKIWPFFDSTSPSEWLVHLWLAEPGVILESTFPFFHLVTGECPRWTPPVATDASDVAPTYYCIPCSSLCCGGSNIFSFRISLWDNFNFHLCDGI